MASSLGFRVYNVSGSHICRYGFLCGHSGVLLRTMLKLKVMTGDSIMVHRIIPICLIWVMTKSWMLPRMNIAL